MYVSGMYLLYEVILFSSLLLMMMCGGIVSWKKAEGD